MPSGPNASLTHGPDCVAAGWADANLQKLLGAELLTLGQNSITIGISMRIIRPSFASSLAALDHLASFPQNLLACLNMEILRESANTHLKSLDRESEMVLATSMILGNLRNDRPSDSVGRRRTITGRLRRQMSEWGWRRGCCVGLPERSWACRTRPQWPKQWPNSNSETGSETGFVSNNSQLPHVAQDGCETTCSTSIAFALGKFGYVSCAKTKSRDVRRQTKNKHDCFASSELTGKILVLLLGTAQRHFRWLAEKQIKRKGKRKNRKESLPS